MKSNSALHSFKTEELIEMATNFNKVSTTKNSLIKKIFENIDKDQEQTEFERTEVHGLTQGTNASKNYGLNKTGDLRILDNSDSTCNPNSYASIMRKRNEGQLAEKLKGFENDQFDNMALQI